MRSSLRITFFLTAFSTLGLIHVLATQFHLYWKYLWLDIPMHILGGVCVALGFFILPVFRIRIPARYMTRTAVLAVVLLVGIIWELFEVLIGLPAFEERYMMDTGIDILMDLLGGVIGYGLIKYSEEL